METGRTTCKIGASGTAGVGQFLSSDLICVRTGDDSKHTWHFRCIKMRFYLLRARTGETWCAIQDEVRASAFRGLMLRRVA